MRLNNLPQIVTRRKKRLGQGYGSGKGGHTSSRGQKGQKARGNIPAHFVGTSWVWFKRLPFIRGKSRFVRLSSSYTLTLSDLGKLASGSLVNHETLIKAKLLPKNVSSRDIVKIVASGKLDKKLKVMIPASQTAVSMIKKAGGEYRVQTD